MPVMHFDTHKFVRRLRDAGISESQAEALSDALGEVQSEANRLRLAVLYSLCGPDKLIDKGRAVGVAKGWRHASSPPES